MEGWVGAGREYHQAVLPRNLARQIWAPLFLELQSTLNGLINITESFSVFPTQGSVWRAPNPTLSR